MNKELLPTQYGPDDIVSRTIFNAESPRIKFVLKEAGKGNKILDIGCFLGFYSECMRLRGNEVTGIDVSREVIEEARRRYPLIRFERVDAMKLTESFEPESFDTVTASEVIEHVINPSLFLIQIRSVLKKGGTLVLTTQNSNAIHYRLRMLLGKFRWDFSHFRLYSTPEIVQTVTNAGFTPRTVKVLPIDKNRRHKITRLFVYYAAKLYPPFGWTTGILATKDAFAPEEFATKK